LNIENGGKRMGKCSDCKECHCDNSGDVPKDDKSTVGNQEKKNQGDEKKYV